MHRRELLKLFGIGSSVVPLLAGVPEMQAESKLIEVPKLEPVQARMPERDQLCAKLQDLFVERRIFGVFISPPYGSTFGFTANAMIPYLSLQPIDVTSRDSQYRQFIPGALDISLTMRVVTPPLMRPVRS